MRFVSGLLGWPTLQAEILSRLLPQVSALNRLGGKYLVALEDFGGKKNWTIRVSRTTGEPVGWIWFGPNPAKEGAPWDGLVRIGESFKPPVIWNTFQRYSDGTYRRLEDI